MPSHLPTEAASPDPAPDAASDADGPRAYTAGPLRVGRLRWIICGLLLLATTLNYIDRFTLSFLAKDLQKQFRWTDSEYGWILFAFQASYASMNLVWGGILDRIGSRLGFALAVIWWSLAAMGHAVARGVMGFGFWRLMLGVGEAGNFPAAVKTIAEWFPQRERATATGFLNAGANIGTMVAPFVIGLLVWWKGWQAAFILTGALGFLWVAAWWAIYR